jgi:hypothetical protein
LETPKPRKGATAEEWGHFDFVLGLGKNLLPCVPAGDDVVVAKGSALEGKVGKIPSMFNRAGEAHGLKDWQKRVIQSAEMQQWGQDRRLNLCVRTGKISGCYGLDVDVSDPIKAREIEECVESILGFKLPKRMRDNSGKFLLTFRMKEN